jgi:hypothetical protein
LLFNFHYNQQAESQNRYSTYFALTERLPTHTFIAINMNKPPLPTSQQRRCGFSINRCKDALMSNRIVENYALNNWMAATPALDTLSLCELTLPGSHNAGCDWKASYPIIPGAHWLACQNDSFYAQLHNGARALDVRR